MAVTAPARILQCGEHPGDLKQRIASEAQQTGRSINDVVVGVLAARYRVPFDGSGRRSPGWRGSAKAAYRMPPRLWREISFDATRRGVQKKDVVESALRAHYAG